MLDVLFSPSGAMWVSVAAIGAVITVVALRVLLPYETRYSLYRYYHFW